MGETSDSRKATSEWKKEQVKRFVLSRAGIPRRFTVPSTYWPQSLEEGYRLQHEICRELVGRGERLVGYKISCVAEEAMVPFGLLEPVYAPLFHGSSFATLAEAIAHPFVKPLVECELAFRMRETPKPDEGGEVSRGSLARSISDMLIACEIADDRYAVPATDIGSAVLLADDFMNGGLVIGTPGVPFNEKLLQGLRAEVNVDGLVIREGPVQRIDPIAAVAWLVKKLHLHRRSLEPGHIVLTGSLVWPKEFRRNALISMEIEGIGKLSVDSLAPEVFAR